MPENIVGIMEHLHSHDGTKYSVVFTDRRMIIAKTENLSKGLLAFFFSVIKSPRYPNFTAGKTILEGVNRADEQVAEKIRNSDPDSILRMDKHNLSMPYDGLNRIVMTLTSSSIVIEIFTNENKNYRYSLPSGDIKSVTVQEAFNTYVSMVKLLVPDKIITK